MTTPSRPISVFAPATVANVGPGFDAFGFAVDGPGDTVTVWRSARAGVRIVGIDGDGGALPRAAAKNVAGVVALRMLRAAAARHGVEMRIRKGLPLGSGLGSSSASAVAAAAAMNIVLGDRYDATALIQFAREGERVASGSAHADNVAPALLGGFCIVRSLDPLDVVRVATPRAWHAAVVHPHFDLPTRISRRAVPSRVTVAQLTRNATNAAALVAALACKDIALFGRAMEGDSVVVPARKRLIHGYDAVAEAARKHGAAGVTISGAGPSVLAVAPSRAAARKAAAAMVAAWRVLGIASDVVVSRIGARGARRVT